MEELDKYADLLKQIRVEHEEGVNLSDPNDRVLIFDGLNTFIRVFSAVPSLNDDGIHIGGLVGFMKSVGAMIRQFKPTRCVIVFDGKGGSAKRKKIHKGYKEGRAFKLNVNRAEHMVNSEEYEMQSMNLQFQRLAEYLQQLPITVLSINNIEADDAIAYIVTQLYDQEHQKSTIISSDKDFLQLVSENVSVWRPTQKKLYTPKEVQEDFGIPAHNFIMYKIFKRDDSDNIPGVLGVGDKTIRNKLSVLQESKEIDIDDILSFCNEHIDDGKVFKKIIDQEDVMRLNFKLMQLKDVDISSTIKLSIQRQMETPINTLNKHKFRKMFMEDKMYTAIPNIDFWLSSTFDSLNAYALISQK